MFIYIIATSKQQADNLYAADPNLAIGSYSEACDLLKAVKAPPTDPYYAAKYKVFSLKALEKLDGR